MTQLLKKIRFIIAVLLLLMVFNAGAQQPVPYDSARVEVRKAGSLNTYRSDNEFDYNQQEAKKDSDADNWWYRFLRWMGRMRAHPWWGVVFDILVWGICLFAIVYVVFKLVGMEKIGLFTKNKKDFSELEYLVEQEDIYAINFADAIRDAIQHKNYRLAVRLHYLQTLRLLTDQELIKWKQNKTNDVYVYELKNTPLHTSFNYLTSVYNYAWYGEMPLTTEQFTAVRDEYLQFQKQLNG